MTYRAATAPSCLARRRAVGGTGMGLALAVATVAGTATSANAEDYTVGPGDTVSHIALRTSTTVRQIVAANSLGAQAMIRVGQVLTIPSASAAVPAAAPAAPAATTHAVASGDTVWDLARRYGATVDAIVAANGLGARATILVGQVLSIPGAPSPAAIPAPTAAPVVTGSHTVVRGDTVSALARTYGTTTSAIVAANGLDARATIRIGQALSVPGAPASVPAAPAATGTHTVVRGDTVSDLARTYGTTTSAIVAANGLGARATIRIGQVLSVPGAPASAAPAGLVGSTFAGRTYPAATVASANQNKATLVAIGVPSKAEMQALVAATAREMGVDPALAQAVAYQESGFDHSSVSPANAIGTMQVIPTSGQWASEMVGRQLNLLDPRDNVVAGVAILRRLIDTSGDLPTAIAGYYQGQSSVRRNGMYADTRRYVANVQTLMSRFA